MLSPKKDITLEELYQERMALYSAQSAPVRRFLDAQARLLADAIVQNLDQVNFVLPNSVSVNGEVLTIAADQREQAVNGRSSFLSKKTLRVALNTSLSVLEHTGDPAVSAAGQLLRHATSMHMVYRVLPSGRKVEYRAEEGEEIPTIPTATSETGEPVIAQPAILAATDAVVEEPAEGLQAGKGELQVPYASAARLFFLPQWVAFDEQGRLLVKSAEEAEAYVESMQRFMKALHDTVALAPYMVADPVYQQKRYGMLGQLINQGRALVLYLTSQIIEGIQGRVVKNDLNRGLSISLPYFDDQDLKIQLREVNIIPAGRIPFLPVFLVRAMQEEKAMTAQDTRLSPSTRKYLLIELDWIEKVFTQ